MQSEKLKQFKKGVKGGLPIAIGYCAVSFAFGISAVSGTATHEGLSILQATLISLTNVTSAGQVGGLSVIFSNASYVEMFFMQLIINLRYSLMSISLSQKFDPKMPLIHRFFVAFGITDEIFAISVVRQELTPWFNYGAMAVAIPGWTLGTFLGAFLGNVLPDFIVSALGVAIYGMFVAIFMPDARKSRAVFLVVLASMALSAVFRYVPYVNAVSSGLSVIIITVVVSSLAAIFFPIIKEGGDGRDA